jgi:hypothetical protein
MDVSTTIADDIGNVKMHHTFGGAVPYGHGYMVCNGQLVNQTNYDAIHGSGAYVRDNVAASPINGRYLPAMVNKYGVGALTTPQDGTSAITSVGHPLHLANFAAHNHGYMAYNSGIGQEYTYDSAGNVYYTSDATTGSGTTALASDVNARSLTGQVYTAMHSQTDNIQPDSIELLYILKVI